MQTLLWTEKYRPKTLGEIAGQEGFVQDAQRWVSNPENMPNLLLFGLAGTGKTSAALVLAHEILKDDEADNFTEINASDDRKLEVVRTRIKEIASTRRMGDAPYKIILLDEMDGMTRDAQNSLKRLMERYSENCRFIITCNDVHKIISPLQSRCANYRFKLLDNKSMSAVLSNIVSEEQLSENITMSELTLFIEGLDGDLRRGITELQAAAASGISLGSLTTKLLQPYDNLLQKIVDKKYDDSLNEVHDMLKQSVDMNTVCINLHDCVVESDIEHDRKFKMLRVIGEAEWRSASMTPKVLASWMIGQMV